MEQSTLHGLITLFPETTDFQTKNPVPRVWYLSLWVGDYRNPGSPQNNTNYCPCSWLSTGNKWKILLLETGGSELEASSLLASVHSVEMCITDCWERNVINSFSHLWTLHAIILTCHTFTTFSPEKFQHRGWESCYVITPLAEKKNISFTKVPCITTQRNSSLYLQLHKICYFKINWPFI